MELKEQLKQELLNQKEEKIKENRKENQKLKEIIFYTKPKHPIGENYKKYFKEQGIKFDEKDISLYPEVTSAVQINSTPIIFINDNYLVHGREFNNPGQCVQALKHFANPDFINPPMEIRILESIKNLSNNISKSLQGLNRQLMPVAKVMNQLAEEDKKENAQKKNK